jgi:outer membrane protein OmpA-like peptidoglycan-associated protein
MTFPTRLPALLLLFLLPLLATAQSADRLAAVTALREQAEAANALQLAPQGYQQGVQALERARRDAADGRPAGRVNAALDEARGHFQAALAHVDVAGPIFAGVLAERGHAQEAQAFRFAGDRWMAAERQFADTARRLERGDLERARSEAPALRAAYRDAELAALEGNYLSGARRLLAEAEQLRASTHAPRTLARARELLQQAEMALDQNRRQPEAAAGPIQDATDEAGHVLQIARIGESVRRRERTLEDVILELEAGIARVAGAAGLSADFSRPHREATTALAAEMAAFSAAAGRDRADLADRNRLVASLEDEIGELQDRIGATGAERDQLMMTLQAQARVREQFGQVEALFSPGEARVLREGDRLIIRLTGLTFRSGSSELPRDGAQLLNKVQQAIQVFPGAGLEIEGHTDATGSDAVNQRLSEERALAVSRHLAEQLRLGPGQIRASGYGPSRPVANNATEAGRAQNRRIDVIITPRLREPGF